MQCDCFSHNGFVTRVGREGLTEGREGVRLDKVGSVSAMVEVEDHWADEKVIDEQYRRFLNGS